MMEISNIVVTLLLLLIHNNKAQTTEEWSSAEPDQNMKAQVTSDFRVGLPKVMCYVWSKTVLCNYSFPFKESLNQEETEEQKSDQDQENTRAEGSNMIFSYQSLRLLKQKI